MKILRNSLYITSLGLITISCGSQKNIQKNTVSSYKQPQAVATTTKTHTETPENKSRIEHHGRHDFYTVNIANPAKNDNTISHGSIVSANPAHYKINKDYFPSVGQNFRQRYIIVHYTALDNDKSLRVLTEQSVSSHYLVNDLDDRDIYQLVDENKRAYHAGASYWRKIENLNDTSIGIEIVNRGYTADANANKTFYEYPDWQVKKVAHLIKDIAERYQIPATNILGHSDIAPTRKEDPGPKFPWKKLYTDYGIGMWYDEATKQKYTNQIIPEQFFAERETPPFIFKFQTMLKNFGYGIEPSGSIDRTTKKTIEALQYRFRPELCDGILDIETYAILQALLEKYPAK